MDDGEVKRYREYDAIGARKLVKSVAEWNLPPARFESVGSPALFLSWIRPAIFAAALVADPGESLERTYTSLGLQLDLRFTLVHRLPMILPVGYAAGLRKGTRQDDEFMISLKIL